MDPSAAVFDLDGTLVLSEHRHRAVWAAFFSHRGIPLDEATTRRLTGRRDVDSVADLAELFPGEGPDDLLAQLEEVAGSVELPAISPAPGAEDYVGLLAANGVPLALVTSALRPYVEEVLAGLGLTGAFHALVTAADVTSGKPDPEGSLLACAKLGVRPQDTVGFEDSPAGVAAMVAAGMPCVGIASSFEPEALAAADLVVTSLENLPWPPLPWPH
jgi:HAD superfamily hydrolase (TIGR01509 family)